GLRWSDRHADFRSEVLGLVKTQITKNSVIVPTGSKGGFVIRRSIEELSKEEYQKAGVECYKIFISGLLSVTDNIVNGDIITPENVVRYDEQDPYLVVAADKGTATFSDIANGLSIDHGFWLKDAFASGGKNGYDHKKMGITAKGAWESVKRHFRHFDLDTQTQEFTVVGIGGMAGDVFGNGMLLSEKISLVASFNHKAIFIDPNPNVPVAYKERQRLFEEVKSWEFYDESLLSAGGGIFSRKAKSIKITPEMKSRFDINENELTPDELIVKLMKSPVDLIWNGGIGTFVKSSLEANSAVPDRANDNIRINGKDLRAKVMGEGGNLGFTQLGRIEYNNHGGKIYTDAIDNSAGVSCSDNEVNIKILLEDVINSGKLKAEDRDALLESMTQAVEDKVLDDNYYQGSLLDIEEANAKQNVNYYKDLMEMLEAKDALDRTVENLPTNVELDERIHHGSKVLTAPELSVLLAYAKIDLTARLLETSLVKAPNAEKFLINYFPETLHKYDVEIKNHKLRDDIIATQLANYIINKMGLAFIVKMQSQSVNKVEDIVRSFLISEKLLELPKIYQAIDGLDNKVNASKQVALLSRLQTILENQSLWFLRNLEKPLHVVDSVALMTKVLANAKFQTALSLENPTLEQVELVLNNLDAMQEMQDAAFMAYKLEHDFNGVYKLFAEVADRMSLNSLIAGIKAIKTDNTWDEIASKEFINELHLMKAALAEEVLKEGVSLENFIMQKHIVLQGFREKINSIDVVDFNYSIIKVLVSRLRSLLS
ncbi:MAG TPA: NAD-glutamate dehydrogenase, partial [Alphaproteobacteria bacterium]|nr:NAD-glutamate dehydrogenase [Alphaproteobacteria bacterium]